MSLSGKVCVVLGATGDVGSGAAHQFLLDGATVVLFSRDQSKSEALKKSLLELTKVPADRAIPVSGSFQNEETSAAAAATITKALNGKPIDHVLSSIGFFTVTAGGPTQTSFADVKGQIEEGVYPAFNAAHALLPLIKDREGASYTVNEGGLQHAAFMPQLWLGTLKNSALQGIIHGLQAETKDAKVRVNSFCIHFGIAGFGQAKNKTGMDSVDTRKVGPFFTALVNSNSKGLNICGHNLEDALEKAKKF